MNLLVEPQIKETTLLRVIDLNYNTISSLLQNSINKLLTETDYAVHIQKGQLECTSNFQNNVMGMDGPTVDSHTNNYQFTLQTNNMLENTHQESVMITQQNFQAQHNIIDDELVTARKPELEGEIIVFDSQISPNQKRTPQKIFEEDASCNLAEMFNHVTNMQRVNSRSNQLQYYSSAGMNLTPTVFQAHYIKKHGESLIADQSSF